MSWKSKFGGLGKYRLVVALIALFLVLDAAVLIANTALSHRIDAATAGLDLAGRQGILAQQLAKGLLQLEEARATGAPDEAILDVLRSSYRLFDLTLTAFGQGGPVVDSGGSTAVLDPVTSPVAQLLIQQANDLWQSYQRRLAPVLEGDASDADLARAVAFSQGNGATLTDVMAELRQYFAATVTAANQRLNTVHLIALALALVNFAGILFYFQNRLQRTDRAVFDAQRETREIMETVSEGLFLLDREARIGAHYSRSLERLLGNRQLAGRTLTDVLRDIVPERALKTAEGFVTMLFQPHVNENLVGSLNPLDQVQVHVEDGQGGYESRYLAFKFKRVLEDGGQLVRILVTVDDITAQVGLTQELEDSQKRAEEQMDLLVKLLHVSPKALKDFLARTDQALENINEILKTRVHRRQRYREMLQSIFVIAHTVKGDASLLGLDLFEGKTHEFEDKISELQNLEEITGNDMLGLTVKLNQLMETAASVRGIVSRLTGLTQAFANDLPTAGPPASPKAVAFSDMERLIQKLAEAQGKQIQFLINGIDQLDFPEATAAALQDVVVQLARNAVTHGIEPPEERTRLGKPPAGTIALSCEPNGQGVDLVFRDDGRGISLDAIRQSAITSGRYSADELDQWDDRRILGLMFEPGISTVEGISVDAGRGVGMDVVKRKVKQLGGRLKLANQPGKSCEWRIVLPAAS